MELERDTSTIVSTGINGGYCQISKVLLEPLVELREMRVLQDFHWPTANNQKSTLISGLYNHSTPNN